jgi:hypothetical protein
VETTSSLVGRLIALQPLFVGIAATLLAAFALLAWIAIGSFFLPSSILQHDELAAPSSIVVGSGLTAFLFALSTRAGFVDAGILVVGLLSLAALFLKHGDTRRIVAQTAASYRDALKSSRLLRIAALPVAALLWIYAIAPPRDGDVMRYHLAHIRQIIADGRWEGIADYHYAFPFGSTLNYLPFERLNLPQAAALVNVGLWLVIVAGLLRIARRARAPRVAQLATILFFVHPFVMRTFASAMADAYAILVVFAIALFILSVDDTAADAMVLGFVCWIGAQSRYQLVAWSIAGTIIAVIHFARRKSVIGLKRFALGAAAALVLSAPFYLANWKDFGNPVWPLLVPSINGTAAYTDRVAASYTSAMTGSHDPSYILGQMWDLVTSVTIAPLAFMLLLIIPLSIRDSDQRFRRVSALGLLFLLLWILMEPKLFPRHVLLLLPLGAILFVPAFDGALLRERIGRSVEQLLSAAVILLIVASAVLSQDYARYAFTGDKTSFHRFTWYYDVYDWVNRSTPANARVLVVTYSGHSYYLDRPYRRADPWLSGVIDWSRVASADDLIKELHAGGYEYVIYDDRRWDEFPGGAEMEGAVRAAVARRTLLPVYDGRERLYTSRVRRTFEETRVYVLRVPGNG